MLKRVVHSLGLVEKTKKDSKGKHKLKGSKSSQEFSSRSSKDFLVKIKHVSGQKEQYRHAIPASKLMTKYHGMCVARPEVYKDPHHSVLNRDELLLPGHKYIIISVKEVNRLKRENPVHGRTKEPNGVVTRSPNAHKSRENGRVKAPNGVAGHGTHDQIHNHHKENGKMKEPNGVAGQEMLQKGTNLSPCGCEGQGNCKTKEANGIVEEIEDDTDVDGSSGEGVVEQSPFVAARDFYVAKDKWTRSLRRKGIKGKKPFVPPLPKGRPYRSLQWQPSLPTLKELSP